MSTRYRCTCCQAVSNRGSATNAWFVNERRIRGKGIVGGKGVVSAEIVGIEIESEAPPRDEGVV